MLNTSALEYIEKLETELKEQEKAQAAEKENRLRARLADSIYSVWVGVMDEFIDCNNRYSDELLDDINSDIWNALDSLWAAYEKVAD